MMINGPWWIVGKSHDVISAKGIIARTYGHRANARAIAAVPRMLSITTRVAALEPHEGECACDYCQLVRDARAAINKARS